MQTIYIDVLIFVNLFVNYFILLATEKICHTKLKFIRRMAGNCVATASSLLIFVPELNVFLSLLIKLAVSTAVVLTAFGYKGIKKLLINTGAFYAVTFAYGGICIALWFLFKPSGMVIDNCVVYFNLSPLLLICSSIASYLMLLLLKGFFAKDKDKQFYYTAEICFSGKNVTMPAFFDSGNKLYDSFSDTPVIVVCEKYVAKLLPIQERDKLFNLGFADDSPGGTSTICKYRLIPYSVVGGTGILPAFRPDRVIIYGNGRRLEISDCLIAVSKDDFGGKYGALINSEMLEN